MQRVERSLVIEDELGLQQTLREVLELRSEEVAVCATVADALTLIPSFRPNLVILDFQLADGLGTEVLEGLWAQPSGETPAPVFVAVSGTANTDVTFRLAQLGVQAYVSKPLELESFNNVVDDALRRVPNLTPHLRAVVGHRAIQDVEAEVRETMVKEAVGRAQGNRRGAARMLEISRQLLQHMLRKFED